MSGIDDFINQASQPEPDPMNSFEASIDTMPEQATKRFQLQKQTGFPMAVVEEQEQEVEKRAQIADLQNFLNQADAPATKEWLSKDQNAALSKDSVKEMAFGETLLRGVTDRAVGLVGGVSNLFHGVGADKVLDVDAVGDFLEEIVPLGELYVDKDGIGWRPMDEKAKNRQDDFKAFFNFTEDIQEGIGYEAATSWEDVKDAPLSNVLPFALEQGVVSLPDMMAVLVNLPGYVMARTGELGDERAKNDGRNEATLEDFVKAAPAAVASAVLERIGAKASFGLDDTVKGIKDVLPAAGKAMVKEAGTEAVQEGLEYTGTHLGTEKGMNALEMGDQMLAGSVGGGIYGGSMRLTTGTIEGAIKSSRNAKQQEFFERLHEGQANNQLRHRLPEKEQERLKAILEQNGGAAQEVYIDSEKLNTLYQDGHLDDAFALMDEGDVRELKQNMSGKGFVRMDMASFASHIAGSELFDSVRDDIKLRHDDFTANEAAQFEAEKNDLYAEEYNEAKRAAEVDAELMDDVDKIGEEIRRQLLIAGLPTDEAMHGAALHRAHAKVLQSWGLDPRQYYGLEVVGPFQDEIQNTEVTELDVMIERALSGNQVGTSKPILTYLKSLGVRPDSSAAQALVERGVNNLTFPGLFKSNGIADLSNIVREVGTVFELMAEDGSGNNYVDPNALMEAIENELSGINMMTTDEMEQAARLDEPVTQLVALMDDIGLDWQNMTRDEIKSSLQNAEGDKAGALFQDEQTNRTKKFDNDIRWWKGGLDRFDAGKQSKLRMGRVLNVLRYLGHGSGEITLDYKVYKQIESKHGTNGIDRALWDKLPELMADPLLAFKQERGTYALVLDAKDNNGDQIIAFVTDGKITSLFGKEDKPAQNGLPEETAEEWTGKQLDRAVENKERVYGKSPHEFNRYQGTHRQSRRQQSDGPHQGLGKNLRLEGDVVKEYGGLFYQDGLDPKGSFTPTEQGGIIKLFERSNPSTFLHESGHFFVSNLEKIAAMEEAPEQSQKMLEDLLQFVDASSADELDIVKHGEAARTKQEKLAEAFEKYLSEGKAPSRELLPAFAAFRSWLITIYKELKGRLFGGDQEFPISEGIKEVFDRLLATDDEIQAAQEYTSFNVKEGALSEMDEADAKAYLEADAAARESAIAEMEALKIKEEVNRESRAWKDEYKKVRETVERETNSQPVYIAIDLLRDKENEIKLSREAIVDMHGEEGLKLLPKGLYTSKHGLHPDILADRLGFESGSDLIQQLWNAKKNKKERQKLIDETATQKMNEVHGSLRDNQRQAAEAALNAVHNDKRGMAIALELKVAAKNTGQPNTPASVAREIAKRTLSSKRVKDAARPGQFLSQSLKAAREAKHAILKKDWGRAYEASRQQLLNHYLYIEAKKVREELEKIERKMLKLSGPATKLRGIAPDYVERIQDLLSIYEFRSSFKKQEKLNKMRQWLAEKQEDEDIVPDIPDELLVASEKTHYKNLTMEELRGLFDTVKHLEALGRNKKKLFLANEKRELDAVAKEVADSIYNNWKGEIRLPDVSQTDIEKKRDAFLRRFSLRKMEFLFRELDGFKPGPVQKYIFGIITNASSDLEERRHQASKAMRELFEKYSSKEAGKMFTQKVHIKSIGMSLTKSSILSVALNTGNKDNKDKLLKSYKWSEVELNEVLSHLDDRDWDFVEGVWGFIDSYWEETVSLDKATKGVAPPKVEAEGFYLPSGRFIKGGYYPLKYDDRQSDKPVQHNAEEMFKQITRGEMGRPTTSQGRTKERLAAVHGMKVKLDLDVFFQAIDETVHDLAMRKAALDVARIMNHKEVSDAFRDTVGPLRMQQLRDWMADSIAGDVKPPSGFWDTAAQFLRKRTTIMTMGYKLSTILLQPLGYTQSMARMISDTGSVRGGLKYAGKALTDFYSAPREKMDFIYERSPLMRERSRTFDREIHDSVKMIKGGKLAMYEASLLMMIGKAQKLVDLPTWMAGYQFELDRTGDEAKAISYADSVVRMTQSSGLAADLSAVQRGSEAQKLLTMYMTFFSAMHNMVVDEFKMTKEQGLKRAHILTTNIMLLTFIPANLFPALFAAAGTGGPEEDESWALWLTKNWVTFGLAGIPMLRDLLSSIVSGFPYQVSPVQGTLKNIPDLATQIEQGELDKALAKTALKSAAIMPGIPPLPANQMWLTGEYIFDVSTGEKEPENVFEAFIEAFVQKDFNDK